MSAYKGDYDTFERTRAEHMKNQQKAFESNERSREHMQVFFSPLLYRVTNHVPMTYILREHDCIGSLPQF